MPRAGPGEPPRRYPSGRDARAVSTFDPGQSSDR